MELAETGKSMEQTAFTGNASRSRAGPWAGRIVSGLVVLFLAFDAVGKLLELAPVVAGTTQLGYPAIAVRGIGIVLLACTVAYSVPRTAVLGAILLTGYLGGAVASQARMGYPLFSHVLFPAYVGILVWGGVYLRDARVRPLLPLRARA